MVALPTPQQLQYMHEHIDESAVNSIHISSGICVGFTLLSLVLRILSRRCKGASLASDDYEIFFGFIFYVALITAFGVDTRFGLGHHVLLVTNVKVFTIINIVAMSLYISGMVCVKCSILMLYYRIFRLEEPQKRALIALAVFIVIWALTAFFCSIFLCYPIESSWNPTIDGTCIDYGQVTLVIGILNVIVDFALLAIPIPIVWGLYMPTRRKFLLSLTFSVGCCACFISIARLFYARSVYSTYDPSWDNVTPTILSGLEVSTGIIACCTMTYRPLIERIFGTGHSAGRNPGRAQAIGQKRWNKIRIQHDVELITNLNV